MPKEGFGAEQISRQEFEEFRNAKTQTDVEKIINANENSEIKNKLLITKEQQVKEILKICEFGISDYSAKQISEKDYPQEIINEAAKRLIINNFRNNRPFIARDVIEYLQIPENIILSFEIQKEAELALLNCLAEGEIRISGKALDIIRSFHISQNFLKTEKVKQAIILGLIGKMAENHTESSIIDYLREIRDHFYLRMNNVKINNKHYSIEPDFNEKYFGKNKSAVIDASDIYEFNFFSAIDKIASNDLKIKAKKQILPVYKDFFLKNWNVNIYNIWQKEFSNIPQNNFLQLVRFTNCDQRLLFQFNSLYQKIRKSSTKCEKMLFNITNANEMDPDLLSIIVNKLKQLGVDDSIQFDNLSKVFKSLIFLDQIQKAAKYKYDEDEEGNWNNDDNQNDLQPTKELKEIDFQEIINQSYSLEELSNKLKQISLETIKQILPSENLTIEKIENLWEKWKNLEPLFIYAGKMKGAGLGGTLKLIGEMASKMDPPNYEGWKTWRYNLENETVKNQIGHLSSAQQEIWKVDYAAEMGELELAFTPTDKPEKIFGEIKNAIEHLSDKKQFIKEYFTKLYKETAGDFAKTKIAISKNLEELKKDLIEINNGIGLMSDERELSKLFNFIEKLKKKNKINEVNQNPQNVELFKKYNFNTDSSKDEFDKAVVKSKENKHKLLQEKILEIFKKYGVEDDSDKNLYSTSKDLQILIQLLHLSNLTPQQLASGKLTSDKKISIKDTLEKLKGQFRDEQTFLGYMENINTIISEKGEVGKKRPAMIFTDNPQIGINIGKYPIGCGSCQNYEGDTNWNRALAGYMSDSHIKVCYLFDIDKLPEEIKKKIEEQGIGEVLSEIHPQDILNASLARSVIKIGKDDKNKPMIFSEPTYSVVNKGDLSMNNYFNIFLKTILSDPMKVKLCRGAGNITITIPESKNQAGQYEDYAVAGGGVGMGIQQGSYLMSVGEVNLKQFNKEEQEIAERIRSSER